MLLRHQPDKCVLSGASYVDRLPVELWGLVVAYLSREDQRTCISVSRTLRAVSSTRLFSRVTIYFGLWKPSGVILSLGHDTFAKHHDFIEDMSARNVRSCELLRRVRRDPEFAKLIKNLAVHAYTPGLGAYEAHTLADSLEYLTALTSFSYHGMYPLIHSEIVGALVKASGATLIDFRASALESRLWTRPVMFAQLRNLETLSFVREPYERPSYSDNQAVCSCVEVASASGRLRRLHVGGDVIWILPVRVFENLKGLSIQEPETLGGLELVLRHCGQLESLSLVVNSIWTEKHLNNALEADPKALPFLSSFKLVIHGDGFNRHPDTIAEFVANKQDLRRLDVFLNMDSADEGVYPQFIELLPKLPKLEVLGLGLAGHEYTTEKLLRLHEKLPLGLKALLIRFDWEVNDIPSSFWMELFRKRASLEYLHILDRNWTLDLKQQLLEDHPSQLQLVGYGPYLRWMEWDRLAKMWVYTSRWSDLKVRFRDVEDFGCEDWEWLLRYHDWAELDSLWPGIPPEDM
ncbi:hypothetical protein C8Q77DRAFT_1118354 [Trametes polyzona]|nr:hypothetical protein C8Q77DRAFT_1118354 [Trametes polyzona]